MAPPPFWRGYLKLSLVTCPVAMTPATTESEKIRFHTLNRKTGNRVSNQYVDAVTGEPVERDDEVKGYQRGENDYIFLEDEELEAVALESVRTIDIDNFVPADSIDWIWYDRPYFLKPSDPVGEEAFAVIREAMASTGMVGISSLVLRNRERAVLLEPRDKGIVIWTLRYGDEVRNPASYFGKIDKQELSPEAGQLVERLIEEHKKPWQAKMVHDPVQERLQELIASKKRKARPPKPARDEAPPPPSNVVNIMDALRKSVASEHVPSKRRSAIPRKSRSKKSSSPPRPKAPSAPRNSSRRRES